VVGEVRGGECFHLVQAMNTGHGGCLATTHANDPTSTLRRLESLCLMSGFELPMVAIRAQVASAIHLIICCDRLQDGTRKVTRISEVLPLDSKGEYRTQDLFVFTPIGKDEDGMVLGYHAPTGIVPTFAAKARTYGFADLVDGFFDPETYGVPPPPVFALGEQYTVRWAPSLKHRERGEPDPEEFAEELAAFEKKMKAEAKAARDERTPPLGVEPFPPTESEAPMVVRAKPQAKVAEVPRDQPPVEVTDPNKTPMPVPRKRPDTLPEEAKVEVSSDLYSDARKQNTAIRSYPERVPVPARPGAPRPDPAARRSRASAEEEEPTREADEKTRIKNTGDKGRR
jgi:pilus assembly protein CpaF